MQWIVRRAAETDVAELGRVNVAAWRHTYRGIAPDQFLDEMDESRRRQSWSRWVCLPPPDSVFVATNGVDHRVAAYCAVGAVREPQEDAHPVLPTGELMSIYADPEVWGRGAGHVVHDAALAALAGFGFRHAVLWVFEDNARARGFYERHGWRYDGVGKELEIAGRRPVEVRYSTALPSRRAP